MAAVVVGSRLGAARRRVRDLHVRVSAVVWNAVDDATVAPLPADDADQFVVPRLDDVGDTRPRVTPGAGAAPLPPAPPVHRSRRRGLERFLVKDD